MKLERADIMKFERANIMKEHVHFSLVAISISVPGKIVDIIIVNDYNRIVKVFVGKSSILGYYANMSVIMDRRKSISHIKKKSITINLAFMAKICYTQIKSFTIICVVK